MNETIINDLGINDATNTMQAAIDQVVEIITVYGLDVLGAIIILVVGMWFAGWVSRMVAKALGKASKIDATLISFFSSTAKYVIMAFVGIAVLNQFGVQTASLIAILGAAGLAIGLALQGTLSNVAAGVMLLIFRPFRVGDYVEAAGHGGTIRELNLFFTLMNTPDNILISIPNAKIWGDSIRNFNANKTRRVDFVFGVSYSSDLDKAKSTIMDVISSDERTHADPEPLVEVMDLGESSVNLVARVWVNTPDYWAVKFSLNKAVKERLDKEGIEIPFPTRTIYSQSD
ncbi:MAG: mechanosensitive ion channel [Rhodospirillaceae bacterium]|nr:mechanosensitive ion channel [Rhodospirillaceae bacterium]